MCCDVTQCHTFANVLQHTSCHTHCNTLQHTATHCNTLQHTATHCITRQHMATHCNARQHTATHGNTRQHTATHGNTLQHYYNIYYIIHICICLWPHKQWYMSIKFYVCESDGYTIFGVDVSAHTSYICVTHMRANVLWHTSRHTRIHTMFYVKNKIGPKPGAHTYKQTQSLSLSHTHTLTYTHTVSVSLPYTFSF